VEYFNNTNLSGAPAWTTTTDQIAFNWGTGGPGGGISGSAFSARFNREAHFDAGTYRFYATSDDGVRVFVDDRLIIDGWKTQPATTYYGDIALSQGTHRVRVEYYQSGGDALLYLNWTRIY
jgi:hypothetical protein